VYWVPVAGLVGILALYFVRTRSGSRTGSLNGWSVFIEHK
jgi:hypothetical protein